MVHSHILASAVISEMRDQVCKRSNANERAAAVMRQDEADRPLSYFFTRV